MIDSAHLMQGKGISVNELTLDARLSCTNARRCVSTCAHFEGVVIFICRGTGQTSRSYGLRRGWTEEASDEVPNGANADCS